MTVYCGPVLVLRHPAVLLPPRGPQASLCVPGMDPGLEVQVLCGASWKQSQAAGNCTQVGASRDNLAWADQRGKERDAQNPTEIGVVLGPGARYQSAPRSRGFLPPPGARRVRFSL